MYQTIDFTDCHLFTSNHSLAARSAAFLSIMIQTRLYKLMQMLDLKIQTVGQNQKQNIFHSVWLSTLYNNINILMLQLMWYCSITRSDGNNATSACDNYAPQSTVYYIIQIINVSWILSALPGLASQTQAVTLTPGRHQFRYYTVEPPLLSRANKQRQLF